MAYGPLLRLFGHGNSSRSSRVPPQAKWGMLLIRAWSGLLSPVANECFRHNQLNSSSSALSRQWMLFGPNPVLCDTPFKPGGQATSPFGYLLFHLHSNSSKWQRMPGTMLAGNNSFKHPGVWLSAWLGAARWSAAGASTICASSCCCAASAAAPWEDPPQTLQNMSPQVPEPGCAQLR